MHSTQSEDTDPAHNLAGLGIIVSTVQSGSSLDLKPHVVDTTSLLCASNKLLHHSPSDSLSKYGRSVLNEIERHSEGRSDDAPPLIVTVPKGMLSLSNANSVIQAPQRNGYVIQDSSNLLQCHSDVGSSLFVQSSHSGGQPLSPSATATDSNSPTSGDDCAKKREMRLFKNREAARECRRKKKEYVRCLENRVAVLESQNKSLIEELRSLKEHYQSKEQLYSRADASDSKDLYQQDLLPNKQLYSRADASDSKDHYQQDDNVS